MLFSSDKARLLGLHKELDKVEVPCCLTEFKLEPDNDNLMVKVEIDKSNNDIVLHQGLESIHLSYETARKLEAIIAYWRLNTTGL